MIDTSHSKVFQDVREMTKEELQDLYGITINEDGSVSDPTEGKQFPSLNDWAAYMAELDYSYRSFEKIGGKYHFDDE